MIWQMFARSAEFIRKPLVTAAAIAALGGLYVDMGRRSADDMQAHPHQMTITAAEYVEGIGGVPGIGLPLGMAWACRRRKVATIEKLGVQSQLVSLAKASEQKNISQSPAIAAVLKTA